jgi:hypothetical protein
LFDEKNRGSKISWGLIPDPDPTIAPSQIRIPDPGGKKAPDPGSGTRSATLGVIILV